eukprot:symbB.v1.2.012461.t1/scaffold858.1/size157433/9
MPNMKGLLLLVVDRSSQSRWIALNRTARQVSLSVVQVLSTYRVLRRFNGDLARLSSEHKTLHVRNPDNMRKSRKAVATDPLEAKRVIEAGGHIINDRVNGMLAMTRALGDHMLKMPMLPNDVVSNVPDITSTDVTKQDSFIILACDGVWDVINDQQATSLYQREDFGYDTLASEVLHLCGDFDTAGFEKEGTSFPSELVKLSAEEAVQLVLESMRELTPIARQLEADGRSMAEILSRMLVEEALARGSNDNISSMDDLAEQEPVTKGEDALYLPPPWERFQDEDGQCVYLNQETGESQFEPPFSADCRDLEDRVSASAVRKVAVLGGGAFGTAMANHLASKGITVQLWAREEEVVQSINEKHENVVYLAGISLSYNIIGTSSVADAVNGAEQVYLIIPTPFIEKWLAEYQNNLPWWVPLVCCSKGIEKESLRTPYEILVDELPGKYHAKLAVVSGPSFAKEIGIGLPTSVTCAAHDSEVAKQVQVALATRNFRVYTATDVIGAELCERH